MGADAAKRVTRHPPSPPVEVGIIDHSEVASWPLTFENEFHNAACPAVITAKREEKGILPTMICLRIVMRPDVADANVSLHELIAKQIQPSVIEALNDRVKFAIG